MKNSLISNHRSQKGTKVQRIPLIISSDSRSDVSSKYSSGGLLVGVARSGPNSSSRSYKQSTEIFKFAQNFEFQLILNVATTLDP